MGHLFVYCGTLPLKLKPVIAGLLREITLYTNLVLFGVVMQRVLHMIIKKSPIM